MNIEKEKNAIKYIQKFYPRDIYTREPEPYYLCYSGGKDSDCILALTKMAGVKFEAVHNLTTVDAPETVNYVKSNPDVKIIKPERTMWQLIPQKKMPPTRIVRYCCLELKEHGGRFRTKITGVRWSESANRKNNQGFVRFTDKPKTIQKMAEEAGLAYFITPKGGLVLNDDNDESRDFVDHCYRTSTVMVNPIVDWSEKDVWEFLHYYGIKGNPLYQVAEKNGTYCPLGQKRIGCIGCPMKGRKGMIEDLVKYPKYRDNYLRAFSKMLEARKQARCESTWKNARDVMMWWVGDDPQQLSLFGEPEYLKGACM